MFIKDTSCISPQDTFNDSKFQGDLKSFDDNMIFAFEPNYKELIPLGLLRRMSKLVKMAVSTGMPLIEKHAPLDGIIIGTSNGSVEHSLRFLNQIIDYEEGVLTPTDFVQSTSNCVAGNLALMGKITGYNTTHVNQGLTFESCILDALLLFEDQSVQQLLIGGGEELSRANHNIESQRNLYKESNINSLDLLNTDSLGTLPGEGFAMFIVEKNRSESSIGELVDVDTVSHVSKDDVLEKALHFLKKNSLSMSDIDTFILGRNGDNRHDHLYDAFESSFIKEEQTILTYKHLTGEYYCASSFATWLACHVFQGHTIPNEMVWKKGDRPHQNILIYNNHEGKQHGFILMRKD